MSDSQESMLVESPEGALPAQPAERVNRPLERYLTIVTPEQVQLQYRTAGIGSRAGAVLIDWAVLSGFYLLLFAATAGVVGLIKLKAGGQFLMAAAIIVAFLVQYGYFWLSEFFMSGRTIGKKAVGLRVIQDNGQTLTFLSAALRNLFRIIDMIPFGYLVGMLVCFFHPKEKRLGDLVAGTVVVHEEGRGRVRRRRRIEKALSRWPVPPLMLDDDCRKRMTEDDWAMLSGFIERLPYLSTIRLDEIGYRLAVYLIARLQLSVGPGFGGLGHSTPFLIAMYRAFQDDWELPYV